MQFIMRCMAFGLQQASRTCELAAMTAASARMDAGV